MLEDGHGPRHVVVAKVGHKCADVDTDHLMAGKTLTFDIEILEVCASCASLNCRFDYEAPWLCAALTFCGM